MDKKIKITNAICVFLMLFIFAFAVIKTNRQENAIQVSAQASSLSNQKIGWGIKRVEDHAQPDLGAKNKQILDQYDGIAMGNANKSYVYLTFDEGYEAGYTPKILEVLKQNNVKACFFITAHFLNTQPELVKKMIDEGHIVGNHIPLTLMTLI